VEIYHHAPSHGHYAWDNFYLCTIHNSFHTTKAKTYSEPLVFSEYSVFHNRSEKKGLTFIP